MRGRWTVAVALIGAAALVAIAVGVTYLSVDARSLPSVLGKVAGASAKRTERGFFAVMLGGLLLLLAIVFNQFRPGGALDLGRSGPADRPQPDDQAATE